MIGVLIRIDTQRWQTYGPNIHGRSDGRVQCYDGDIVGLLESELNQISSRFNLKLLDNYVIDGIEFAVKDNPTDPSSDLSASDVVGCHSNQYGQERHFRK